MRKLVSILLIGLLMMGGVTTAFAQTNDNQDNELVLDETSENFRLIALKEFQDEYHLINDLRTEDLELRVVLLDKKDKVLDLYIDAVESGKRDLLKKGKEIRKEIGDINQQIEEINQQINVDREATKDSLNEKDLSQASLHINNIIDLLNEKNELLETKIELYDELIELFSN